MLTQDLAKFNEFFIDAEEDAIIRNDCLQRQLGVANSAEEVAAAKQAFVHVHGAHCSTFLSKSGLTWLGGRSVYVFQSRPCLLKCCVSINQFTYRTSEDPDLVSSPMRVNAGELVLLLHWSTLNVAGLIKILKKHDKVHKNHILRAPYVAIALQQVR